jgi:hypothetical protein
MSFLVTPQSVAERPLLRVASGADEAADAAGEGEAASWLGLDHE